MQLQLLPLTQLPSPQVLLPHNWFIAGGTHHRRISVGDQNVGKIAVGSRFFSSKVDATRSIRASAHGTRPPSKTICYILASLMKILATQDSGIFHTSSWFGLISVTLLSSLKRACPCHRCGRRYAKRRHRNQAGD